MITVIIYVPQAPSVLVPVVIDILHVIIIVEDVQDPVDLLHCGLISDLDIVLGDHGHFSGDHGDAFVLEGLLYRVKIFLSGQDLKTVLFFPDIYS